MGEKARVCVGRYAEVPFCFEGLRVRVFCAEELCWFLRENAFLLDGEIMSDRLTDWIEKECELPELAVLLRSMVHEKGLLSGFVTAVLNYVGFLTAEEIRETERTLKDGAGLSLLEKKKSRVDYLLRKKKYAAAIDGYDSLLEECGSGRDAERERPDGGLRGALLYNKGTALAGLMLYGAAAECFRLAWETDRNPESLQGYLAAKRLELPEGEYISFAASLTEYYEASLELERRMEELKGKWPGQPECLRLDQCGQWRAEGDKQRYYEENERLTQALKEGYRSSVGE